MDAALDRHQTHPGRAAWQRWLAVPWQELGVAAALIGAAAAPAFLSAAGDIWADAAADEVVERLVSVGAAADTGIVVSANSVFVEPSTSTADAAMTARIAELDALAPATTTIYTLPGSLTIGPAAELAGTPVRLLARPGAVEALDKIDELPGTVGGVWVPSWLAERRSIAPGDSVEFEAGIVADEAFNDLVPGGGTVASFTVAGIYRSLRSRRLRGVASTSASSCCRSWWRRRCRMRRPRGHPRRTDPRRLRSHRPPRRRPPRRPRLTTLADLGRGRCGPKR